MQSEPTEVTQKTSQDSTQYTQSFSQHGYHDHDNPAALSLRDGSQAAGLPPSARRDDIREVVSSKDPKQDLEQDFYESQRRVSSTSSKRTGSPVDRIIKHEQAVVPTPKRKHDGPAFTIIGRKASGSQRLNLTDFPNGGNPVTDSALA